MNRDPTQVIDAILEQLTEGYTALRAALTRIRTNACFVAPESMGRIWAQMGQELELALPAQPETDWQWRIVDIVQGKEVARP